MTIQFRDQPLSLAPRVGVRNFLPRIGHREAVRDIRDGLVKKPRRISCMYFYDQTGSQLFEQITRLPEYYLTRTEMGLLTEAAEEIRVDLVDRDIIEIGSGSCTKISVLLKAIPPGARESIRYLPTDVSLSALKSAAGILARTFPELTIELIVADFTRQLALIPRQKQRLFCFFGSTIGNFSSRAATRFMTDLGKIMEREEMLLLGLDMVKDPERLERAYNDRRGLTGRFNRNILRVVNQLAQTNFDPRSFAHLAFYNPRPARIEMHLRSRRDQLIESPCFSSGIFLGEGETIHTENSHKFTPARIRHLADVAGMRVKKVFSDPRRWFSLVLFSK